MALPPRARIDPVLRRISPPWTTRCTMPPPPPPPVPGAYLAAALKTDSFGFSFLYSSETSADAPPPEPPSPPMRSSWPPKRKLSSPTRLPPRPKVAAWGAQTGPMIVFGGQDWPSAPAARFPPPPPPPAVQGRPQPAGSRSGSPGVARVASCSARSEGGGTEALVSPVRSNSRGKLLGRPPAFAATGSTLTGSLLLTFLSRNVIVPPWPPSPPPGPERPPAPGSGELLEFTSKSSGPPSNPEASSVPAI